LFQTTILVENNTYIVCNAAKHLDDGEEVLVIGHYKKPQSIWKNPKLYLQMFSWVMKDRDTGCLILKMKGKIVGYTSIQNYVFWPIEYNQVSLYDWICLSYIEKYPKEIEWNLSHDNVDGTESDDENDVNYDNKKNELTFYKCLKDHPLHHSHNITLLDDMREWVPILLVVLF